MSPFQVIVKPIGASCNLACEYCYYTEKSALYPDSRDFRMAPEILESFIRQYLEAMADTPVPEIWLSWQGGEPTLLGLDFFERAIELERRYAPPGKRIRNALQTNATKIDAAWASFFRAHDFLVGVSIDGPEKLHDRYRHDRSGTGSFPSVMAGIGHLMAADVEINALSVVNRYNARKPRDVYRFLKSTGFRHIQFIPIVERLTADGRLAPFPDRNAELRIAPWSVSPEDYGTFQCRVFDDWVRHDVGQVFVQAFDTALGCFLGEPAALCWFNVTCGRGLALEHNGDLYSCDHFVDPAFRLGNIMDRSLPVMANGERQRRFGDSKRLTLPDDCRTCEWRFACGGGCPKHRFVPTVRNGFPISYFCQSQKRFLRHAAPRLRAMRDRILDPSSHPGSLAAAP